MTDNQLSNIRVVLVHTTHPGNIGATARAMKTMGLKHLYLVAPESFPHAAATARAAGADDILDNAVVKSTVSEAIEDCQLIIGASARLRTLSLPLLDPKQCAECLVDTKKQWDEAAILFGTESAGLSNEDLMKCHYHLYVPTVPEFFSLNLASAVQIVTYEVRMAFLRLRALEGEMIEAEMTPKHLDDQLASRKDMERFYEHLERILAHLAFLKPPHTQQVMHRIQRLFNRAQLETRELNILRGIFTAIERRLG